MEVKSALIDDDDDDDDDAVDQIRSTSRDKEL